ncbi:MAG: PTS transporter subunit EIIC, partial [Alphaproteobacteria bacterium]|nr:PTS transporter subunit EIIC [Alphaproteobacteria bacterium]
GVTGDLKRFFAGDPSAGVFMSGFFPVMMFGLPAACLAMYHTARPDRRKMAGGLLVSMALTAFLTGVTEPIEFSFMFLAPPLYAIHTVLTGFSMIVMDMLGVRLGFGFSAGLFDYVINFNKATRPLMLLPVGAAYFALYYGIFRFAILKFNLKMVGREDDDQSATVSIADAGGRGRAFSDALGGSGNVRSVDSCTTRLRLVVRNSSSIDEPRLRALGARGFVRPSETALQVILGPIAEQVAGEMRTALSQSSSSAPLRQRAFSQSSRRSASSAAPAVDPGQVLAILSGLGGAANIRNIAVCSSRLCVGVRSTVLVDERALRTAGTRGVSKMRETVHVLIGPGAADVADRLNADMSAAAR